MEAPLLTPRAGQRSAVESLDYHGVVNAASSRRANLLESTRHRHVWGYSGSTLIKLLTTVLCGVATGAAAVALESAIELLIRKRNLAFQALLAQQSLLLGVASLLAWAVGVLLLGAALVQFIAPAAAGAGVSQVIAFLNGCSLPGLFSLRVYAVKFVGILLSRVAGLALGPEAPLVHLGACTASLLCSLEHREWRPQMPVFRRSQPFSPLRVELNAVSLLPNNACRPVEQGRAPLFGPRGEGGAPGRAPLQQCRPPRDGVCRGSSRPGSSLWRADRRRPV